MIKNKIIEYEIPVVKTLDSISNPYLFMKEIKNLIDEEGVVIVWDSGARAKAKGDWYVQIHRAKSLLENERDIVGCWLDNTLDDLRPLLDQATCDRIDSFIWQVAKDLLDFDDDLEIHLEYVKDFNISRKDFAIASQNMNQVLRAMVFSFYEQEPNSTKRIKFVEDYVKKNLSNNNSYDKIKKNILINSEFKK